MTNRPPPSLSKWIFVLTDILLLIGFVWILQPVLPPRTTGDYVVIVVAATFWMIGAWICIRPWIEEFRARAKHLENETLASAVEQIQRLEEVASRIQTATSAWQSAQDSATRTATAAREIEEKIKANMKDFMDFTDRVNSEEKKHMGLEIEKLRRSEGEWLQAAARMLDHTYLLNQAGQRSGQSNLISQLSNFQNAMRESVRRMGLIPFIPTPGEEFNSRMHQTETPDSEPPAGAVVSDILATGFTFQGQLLRRSLVRVVFPQQETPAEEQPNTVDESNEPQPEREAVAEAPSEPEPTPTPESEQVQEPEPPKAESPTAVEESIVSEPEAEPATSVAEPTPIAEEQPFTASEPEPDLEPQPRRRQRKPDPQTSLPF